MGETELTAHCSTDLTASMKLFQFKVLFFATRFRLLGGGGVKVESMFVQGDSLARGPKLLSIKNYVNQLTDDELTTGYYQEDGATCHTSNASMREIESFFFSRQNYLKKNLWPPRSPDLRPADFFLWAY